MEAESKKTQEQISVLPENVTPEMLNGLADFQAFTQNSARMHQIVREMKEIAELPSEVPQKRENGERDINPLEKVEFPDNGGILTYMGGHKYPYKGFPFHDFVDKIDTIKKVQRATLSSIFHSMKKRSRFQIAFLIFVPWILGDIARAFIYTFFRLIDRFKIKTIRYCDAIRELHRAFSLEYHNDSPEEKEMKGMIRDIVCMVLEFDNAYRFRFQDIIVELDKVALRKNPSKELIRLLKLLSLREKTQEIKDTWKLVQYFLPVYFFLNKSFKQSIVDVLNELDLQKVALSVEDRHYCDERKDYTFGYKLHDTL
jgi:hypothetical protein